MPKAIGSTSLRAAVLQGGVAIQSFGFQRNPRQNEVFPIVTDFLLNRKDWIATPPKRAARNDGVGAL
jgi:hypothetical protein